MATIEPMINTMFTFNDGSTNLNSNHLTINISDNTNYSFGFSGWTYKPKPIYDEFDLYVWEQRKAAGIDEPMPEPIGWEPVAYTGLRFNSALNVTSAINSITGQIYGITS